jgi:4-aminobutyrate aminotransferase-like enzyme
MMASLVRELYQAHNIIAHFSGSDPDILHIMPPLVVEKEHLDRFVSALDQILSGGLLRIVGAFLKDNVLQVAMPGKD